MLITKEVEIICKSDKKYYISKGYDWKYNKTIIVKVNDLQKGSHQLVKVLCDYCLEEIIEKEYRTFIKQRETSVINKDCCKKCSILKVEEGNLLKYGIRSTFQVPEIREKRKITMIELFGAEQPSSSGILQDKRLKIVQERYGVDNVFQLEEVKQKRKITMEERYGNEHSLCVEELKIKRTKTMMDKFGVEHAIQNADVKARIIATNIKRYGTECPLENEKVKEKSRKTCLEKYGVSNFAATKEHKILKKITMFRRYGVEFSMQNAEILAKSRATMFKHGTAPSSTQQRYLHNLLGGELNYPVNNLSLDIAFLEENLYIEYDGGGHDLQVKLGNMTQKDFNKKSIRRYYLLRNKGWKEIIICSDNDYIPQDNVLLDMITHARDFLNKGHSWIKFDISNSKIINSQEEICVDFGKLRCISKII